MSIRRADIHEAVEAALMAVRDSAGGIDSDYLTDSVSRQQSFQFLKLLVERISDLAGELLGEELKAVRRRPKLPGPRARALPAPRPRKKR